MSDANEQLYDVFGIELILISYFFPARIVRGRLTKELPPGWKERNEALVKARSKILARKPAKFDLDMRAYWSAKTIKEILPRRRCFQCSHLVPLIRFKSEFCSIKCERYEKEEKKSWRDGKKALKQLRRANRKNQEVLQSQQTA